MSRHTIARLRWVALVYLPLVLVFLLMGRQVRADGLIVIRNPPAPIPGHFTFAPLEVVYHKVDTTIDNQVAVTSVDQEFYNPNGARLEGDYIFPIPNGAQINKFAMDIDGKQVEAELLPADKARQIYEDIVRKARDPALLEYAGRAMFKVRIFPIEPNSRKRITLKYTELLKSDNNLMDYHYTLNTEKYSSKPLKNVSLKITVNSTDPLTSLYSPTHDVEVRREGAGHAVVGYEAQNVRPDTDFHLYIGRKASAMGISVLSYRPDPDKEGYFLMLAAPTISPSAKAQPKDVVFIMDTSGSMSGPKIEQAKKALRFCVNSLNAGDRFDIVRFSTEAEPFFKGLADASEGNRKKASEFIDGMKASGGTAIQDAILAALAERPGGDNRLFLLVFVTDGQPTVGEQNPDRILAAVKGDKNAANVRVFSFGVGTDVNTKLLDQVAEQSRGWSQYVLPNEDIEVSVSSFFAKVQDPVLARLRFDTGAVASAKIYPKDLPDLFKGDQLVIFGTYSKAGNTAITLTGTIDGKEQKFAQDVRFEEKTDASKEWIGKLWAVRRVGYLLDEIRLRGESKELKDEVTELARKWGIVTPYTAMLIIEDEKARGVATNNRSLSDMERDRVASASAGASSDALRRRMSSGDMAVNNSVNVNAYKQADSLEGLAKAAEQSDAKYQLGVAAGRQAVAVGGGRGGGFGAAGAGGGRSGRGGGGGGGGGVAAGPAQSFSLDGVTVREGSALARSELAAVAPATTMPGGWVSVNGGYVDQSGNIAITRAGSGSITITGGGNLNAGGQTAQPILDGYRVVTNYAQQNRLINNRAFYLNGGQWTDANIQKLDQSKAKHIKIPFNSDAYFTLLKDHPEAAEWLALGNNISFELQGTIYDIVEETTPQETAK